MRRKWRQIFAWGPTAHPSGDFEVTPEWYRNLLRAFKVLRDTHKYLPPVTAMHPEIYQELTGISELRGANYGVIAGLRATESGIEAGFVLNELGCKIDDLGGIGYLSPSFYAAWIDPHTGEKLGPVLREVSLVDVPHQKNISADVGQIYGLSDAVSLAESGFNNTIKEISMMDSEETVTEEPTDAAEPTLSDVMAKIDSKFEELKAMLLSSEESPGEEEVPTDMSEQIAQLKTQLAQQTVRADLGEAATDELVKTLAPVSMSDARGYKALVAQIKSKPASARTQAPVGSTGTTTSAPVSLSESRVVSLAEKAALAGVPRGLPLVKYMEANGVSRDGIVTALAEHSEKITRIYSAVGGR